ncbi:hypothetical protein Taro_053865 [Colocasia esculenta]|uniref:Uncharacterized protein n=1 Tax=Colocasia esculenta TaxID=4460 RepID=A0A843XPH0_COLES|nr:hypothetical protein [Colocasia esculenta]
MESVAEEEEVSVEKGSETQGEGNDNPPENQFREGETASSSDSEDDDGDLQAPVDQAREKGKEVPLLADTPYQRSRSQKIIINLKPVIERLDAQGEILYSLQSDVNSIFMSQASATKELSQVRNAMKWFNKEMGSMKSMLSEILKVVGAQAPPPPPAQPSKRNEEEIARPSGPSDIESGPSGPEIVTQAAAVESGPSGPEIITQAAAMESGPSGPSDQGSGPSGLVESEQILAEEAAVALEPPAPSPTQTPAPSSPPSASTAPPAPQPFKQPQPRTISSPTPFPTHSSSPTVSHIPPPPPLSEVPPASSAGASSSSGPSFFGPSEPTSSNPHSLLHPNPPPSFITIIPEGAQIDGPYLRAIKDEFEVAILRSVLQVFIGTTCLGFDLFSAQMVSGSEHSSRDGSRLRRHRTLSIAPSSSPQGPSMASTSSVPGPSAPSAPSWGRGTGRRGPTSGVTERRLSDGQQWNVSLVRGYGMSPTANHFTSRMGVLTYQWERIEKTDREMLAQMSAMQRSWRSKQKQKHFNGKSLDDVIASVPVGVNSSDWQSMCEMWTIGDERSNMHGRNPHRLELFKMGRCKDLPDGSESCVDEESRRRYVRGYDLDDCYFLRR